MEGKEGREEGREGQRKAERERKKGARGERVRDEYGPSVLTSRQVFEQAAYTPGRTSVNIWRSFVLTRRRHPEQSLDCTILRQRRAKPFLKSPPKAKGPAVSLCGSGNTLDLHCVGRKCWPKRTAIYLSASVLLVMPIKFPFFMYLNYCLKKNLSLQSRHFDPQQGYSVNYVSSGYGASAV